jgi:hypothetical protein
VLAPGISVSRHIPSGITIGQRILSRLIALCVICGYSTLVGAALYLVAMKAVWTLGYPKERLLLFDGVVVLFKDVLPLFLILYFTAKRSSSAASSSSSAASSSSSAASSRPGGTRVSMTSFLTAAPGHHSGGGGGGMGGGGGSVSGNSRHSYTRIDSVDDSVA